MRNLFDPDVLGWPRLRDSLHIYVLPDADFTSSMRPAFDAIERFEGCAVVEPRWLHATITRIPWWRNEIDRTLLDLFAVELGEIAAGTAKFAIPCPARSFARTALEWSARTTVDGSRFSTVLAPLQRISLGGASAPRGTDDSACIPGLRNHELRLGTTRARTFRNRHRGHTRSDSTAFRSRPPEPSRRHVYVGRSLNACPGRSRCLIMATS